MREVADAHAAEPANKRTEADQDAPRTSSATVNRMLALICSILRAAVEWEWLDRMPRVRLRKEPEQRVRWLSRAEADSLLAVLPYHLRAPARLTLATGLREQNVLRLRCISLHDK